jgi:hypothetical protein
MPIIEMILLPCMAWIIHRQEQQFKMFNDLENKLLIMEERMARRRGDQ